MEEVRGGALLHPSPPLHLLDDLRYGADGGGEGHEEDEVCRKTKRRKRSHSCAHICVLGGGMQSPRKLEKNIPRTRAKRKKKKKAQNEKIIFHFVLCSKSKTETGRSSCRRTREDTRGLTEDAETLRLEDALQRREVDDEQLPHDGGQDGETERAVAAQPHLVDHPGLRSRDGHS